MACQKGALSLEEVRYALHITTMTLEEQRFILIRWCMIGCTSLIDVWFGDAYTGAYLPCWFWHWYSTSCLWLLLSMDHGVIDTLGSVFSAYLVWFGYSLIFVTHPYILHLTPLYLHPSCQSLTPFEPTYFIILHDLILFSWSEENTN